MISYEPSLVSAGALSRLIVWLLFNSSTTEISKGFIFLNQALVVLIPKKHNAEKITEFRPISLIHSFAKLISKILAKRLTPELKKILSYSQNAFIKKLMHT
jgi:hypothetical protein